MAGRIPQLDGLRAIAILVVMVGHVIGYSGFAGLAPFEEIASLGVDLFFVLSGFLITGILTRSKGTQHYYLDFFGRRALRIWPLYYLFLATLYVFGVVISVPDWSFSGHHFGWYLLYAQALRYPRSIGPDPISITWSLAIEEQFYLLWPFVVALTSTATLRRTAWVIVAAAPVFRIVYLHYGASPYIALACRADAIALGSLVALWYQERRVLSGRNGLFAVAGIVVFTVAMGISAVSPMRQVLTHSMSSALFAAVLVLALSPGIAARVLNRAPLRYFGTISYCLYLVHLPVVMILRHYVPSRPALCLIGFVLPVAVAELSRRYFEGPILSLKDRWFASGGEPPMTTGRARAVGI
jgi:peptidoglycan/LPS O-acetylase OafA/YrhL